MLIPKYWACSKSEARQNSGKTFNAICWRSSETSVAAAEQSARQAAENLRNRLLHNEKLDRYGYGTQPLREEITEEFLDSERNQWAVITQNAYGSLVLNTADVMFVDIDFDPKTRTSSNTGLGAIIKSFFSPKSHSEPQNTALAELSQWVLTHSGSGTGGWGIRVYKTAKGLRCLVTHDFFDPKNEKTLGYLRDMKCDPLYIRLCKAQECFRARLTPKPWRCGIAPLAVRYPYLSPIERARKDSWQRSYDAMHPSYRTCEFITEWGKKSDINPRIQQIITLHDKYTLGSPDAPLA